MPVFVDGMFGKIQMYLLPGDTPMLCGRPIMEMLGMSMDFENRQIRFRANSWRPATIGAHGEYLQSLAPDDSMSMYDLTKPQFELKVMEGVEGSTVPVKLDEFNSEEHVFTSADQPKFGGRSLKKHFYKTAATLISTELNEVNAYVTKELHPVQKEPPRVLWEVYCGQARTSAVAESLGMQTETFSIESGWDFELLEHQEAFLQKLEAEMPHEVLITPVCKLWSQMQNLACRTEEHKKVWIQLRQHDHDRHLMFARKVYLKQVLAGRHCHLEQEGHFNLVLCFFLIWYYLFWCSP